MNNTPANNSLFLKAKGRIRTLLCETHLNPSQKNWLTRHWLILDGSWLKILAIVSMTIDHVAAIAIWRMPIGITPLFFIGSHPVKIYTLMRMIGRLAFPIFSFLLVEGFLHTHSRKRYGLNLFLFALISEIPWNLIHNGALLYPKQNVFFTLFLGYLGICAIEYLKHSRLRQIIALTLLLALSFVLRADYGCSGFAFILVLYILRNNRIPQAIIGSCILPSRWQAGLAFIPLSMYNGKRGFIKGVFAKYFFYLYYPLHLFILYLIFR